MSPAARSGAMELKANARMYALTPALAEAWRVLFAWASRRSGVPLVDLEHPAPAPLEALWSRPDLGLAFVCGYPFASGRYALEAVAAPIPSPPRYGGRPVYGTDLVVSAASALRTLPDTFGGRIGWTAEHSQSGFNAVRYHLLPFRRRRSAPLYRESVGPLLTPRRVIEAVLSGAIDVGPLDSYAHDLLRLHEPQTAALLRVVDTTAFTPIPLLAASRSVDPGMRGALTGALQTAADDDEARALLGPLLLRGFAATGLPDYDVLLRQAGEAEAAGYLAPG